MTVVTCMMRSALVLDSGIPFMFSHQKYSVTAIAKKTEKISGGICIPNLVAAVASLNQPPQVLAGADAADRSGENIVEQQGGDGKPRNK